MKSDKAGQEDQQAGYLHSQCAWRARARCQAKEAGWLSQAATCLHKVRQGWPGGPAGRASSQPVCIIEHCQNRETQGLPGQGKGV